MWLIYDLVLYIVKNPSVIQTATHKYKTGVRQMGLLHSISVIKQIN